MLALAHAHHFAHPQVQARLDAVDEGGFSGARGPGYHGDVVFEMSAQGVEADVLDGADIEDCIADILIQSEQFPGLLLAREIDFVDDDEAGDF